MSIELTREQRQAMETSRGTPVDVVDPDTNQCYVLLAQEQYERVRWLLDQRAGDVSVSVAQGILRSQQAFWRDLPQLRQNRRNQGKWVCYHEDECIGIATSDELLIRECVLRGIPDDRYDLFVIRPRPMPPWEPEEVEPPAPTPVAVNGETVSVKPYQIIVWLSIGIRQIVEWNPGMPRLPAVLDTGNNHNLAIGQGHVARWAGLQPAALQIWNLLRAHKRPGSSGFAGLVSTV